MANQGKRPRYTDSDGTRKAPYLYSLEYDFEQLNGRWFVPRWYVAAIAGRPATAPHAPWHLHKWVSGGRHMIRCCVTRAEARAVAGYQRHFEDTVRLRVTRGMP